MRRAEQIESGGLVLGLFVSAIGLFVAHVIGGSNSDEAKPQSKPRGRAPSAPSLAPSSAITPPYRTPTQPPAQQPRQPMTTGPIYTPQIWELVLAPYAAINNVPIEFATEWITEESNGNPCAIGNPEEYGPDGNPREIGIAQLFNPDDLVALKITGAQLRAYCNPNKVPYKVKRPDGSIVTIMGPSQETIRPLTEDEMQAQAQATIGKITQSRSYAAHYAAISNVKWPSTSIDFWRLVKLVHGLPGLVSSGLPNVTAYLGRAPISWAEFRSCIESGKVKCDANTEIRRAGFPQDFDNAEKATSMMQGQAIA